MKAVEAAHRLLLNQNDRWRIRREVLQDDHRIAPTVDILIAKAELLLYKGDIKTARGLFQMADDLKPGNPRVASGLQETGGS